MGDLEARELFDRSVVTLIQSWRYLASGSPGAEVVETDGAAIAVFVHSPDREFLNNAVLAREIENLGATLETIERTYAEHGIEHFAVWVHESEEAAAKEVKARGYGFETSTRTMAMPISELADVDMSKLDLIELSQADFWEVDALLPELSPQGAHFCVSRFNGENAAKLMAFDHDGDCGVYMVETAESARRQGLATALSAYAVGEARKRGCETASLQATEMAEGVYARVGFRDLGRFFEFVPQS
jgi:GNAT superfamily N-acetyltransferase